MKGKWEVGKREVGKRKSEVGKWETGNGKWEMGRFTRPDPA